MSRPAEKQHIVPMRQFAPTGQDCRYDAYTGDSEDGASDPEDYNDPYEDVDSDPDPVPASEYNRVQQARSRDPDDDLEHTGDADPDALSSDSDRDEAAQKEQSRERGSGRSHAAKLRQKYASRGAPEPIANTAEFKKPPEEEQLGIAVDVLRALKLYHQLTRRDPKNRDIMSSMQEFIQHTHNSVNESIAPLATPTEWQESRILHVNGKRVVKSDGIVPIVKYILEHELDPRECQIEEVGLESIPEEGARSSQPRRLVDEEDEDEAEFDDAERILEREPEIATQRAHGGMGVKIVSSPQ
jgi:hypothetical protein